MPAEEGTSIGSIPLLHLPREALCVFTL